MEGKMIKFSRVRIVTAFVTGLKIVMEKCEFQEKIMPTTCFYLHLNLPKYDKLKLECAVVSTVQCTFA